MPPKRPAPTWDFTKMLSSSDIVLSQSPEIPDDNMYSERTLTGATLRKHNKITNKHFIVSLTLVGSGC